MDDARAIGLIDFAELVVDTDVAKISVVGIGMRSHAGVAATMFKALAAENINIKVITTSEINDLGDDRRKYMELAGRPCTTPSPSKRRDPGRDPSRGADRQDCRFHPGRGD